MPTQPNPDSPFLPARLQATFGVRAPGTPTMAGKPGVQAADLSFPSPPAPAAAPPGRPATPQAPAPTAATPAAATPQAKPPKPAGQQQQDKGGRPATGTPAPAPTPQAEAGIAPLGVPVPRQEGTPGLLLSPEGDLRYREAVLRGRDELGPIPRIFRHASLPQLPFELGRYNWNPFTSIWHKGGE
jgi:hypothetical protein